MRPGARDVLVDLFDAHFVESQNELGIKIIGQFRDLDDPDRFVWLRGFPDMTTRAERLAAFYGGPVWKEHREAANATMVDVRDVLLLRPARRDSPFALDGSDGIVAAVIRSLEDSEDETEVVSTFERDVAPSLEALLGYCVTEPGPNDFPALPVREGERVFVWFAAFPNREALDRSIQPGPNTHVVRLAPTPRSLIPACA